MGDAGAVERAMTFTHRLAVEADCAAIRALMDDAIAQHLKASLDPAQVELSKSIMGLDTQLIADRSYFLVEENGRLAGCGGWSRRATLYGGDHSTAQRNRACSISPRTPPASAPCTPTRISNAAASAVSSSISARLPRATPGSDRSS
jgi:hypothetical protein